MRIGVPKETTGGERRVAMVPEVVGKLTRAGGEDAAAPEVLVQRGAGEGALIPDAAYAEAGATLVDEAPFDCDVVVKVAAPNADEIGRLGSETTLIGFLGPLTNGEGVRALAAAGVTSFAMEAVPRISRAQSMDALSSQANISGYRSALIGAQELGRFYPMLMTAAGTIRPATVLVLGAGVAGLQAIATARRLGAVVTATDVRPATKEQVESLGAKFVAVEDEEFKQAETAAGYAKEMSAEYKAKQAALVAAHIAKQDVVVTTALIPGRPAPRLVTADMVQSMRPGSVIVDLAVERGGNCELAKAGELVTTSGGVKIVGYSSVTRLAATASALYARNLYAFVETLIDKSSQSLKVNWDDELVKATCLTHDGAIVHPNFQPKPV
jgi:H+-translocating NAD(P) transhydrogenase subunit alpha